MPDAPSTETFEQAKQHFVQGLACLVDDRAAAAEAHFTASLALLPGRVSTLVNLAATRLRLGKFEEALHAADAVLRQESANADAWLHRATALGSLQRLEEAAAGFERLLAIDETQPTYWLRHAQTLHALDRHREALRSYERALALEPAVPGTWTRYGDILREENRLDEAAQAFTRAIEHGGDEALNRYYLAAVTQAAAPASAPREYVRALFDGYANDFDQHLLGQLGYQAHTVLVRHLEGLSRGSPGPLGPYTSVVDLGCGTGLCGPLVQPLLHPTAHRLVGVDLSAPMLEKANALQVYDALVQADVVEYLQTTDELHDLVLATDVLIYLGELAPLFAAVHRATVAHARFAFSVELPSRDALDIELMPSLRYAHSESYLRKQAAQQGFQVVSAFRQPLRQNQRVPIDGLYVVLERQGS